VSSQTLGTESFIVVGLLLAIPLVLWTAYLGRVGWFTVLIRLAFAAYVVAIVGLVFTPFPLPPWTPLPVESLSGYRPWPYPWVNIVPTYTIRTALRLGLDSYPGRALLGNVLALIPFGIFLPMVWPRFRSVTAMLAVALAISLGIEAGQLGLSLLIRYPYRAADVDDVLLNVIGMILGYAAYRALLAVVSRGRSLQPTV
jgi:glycopeptide antibiotics resistance protein